MIYNKHKAGCLNVFAERSTCFYSYAETNGNEWDELPGRIKRARMEKEKTTMEEIPVYIAHLKIVIERTWEALQNENNAGLSNAMKPFSKRFMNDYIEAFKRNFNLNLVAISDSFNKVVPTFTATLGTKLNVLAPSEMVHRDRSNYACCVHTNVLTANEIKHYKKTGLYDEQGVLREEVEKIRNTEVKDGKEEDDDFPSDRLQIALDKRDSHSLLQLLKKQCCVHEDYGWQLDVDARCKMIGNRKGAKLQQQQPHQDNEGSEGSKGDLLNVIVALDYMYLVMYRREIRNPRDEELGKGKEEEEEYFQWYKKYVWLTPGAVLCLSGYAPHAGMGALRKPTQRDFHTQEAPRIHLYLQRKRHRNEKIGKPINDKGHVVTAFIHTDQLRNVIDETDMDGTIKCSHFMLEPPEISTA